MHKAIEILDNLKWQEARDGKPCYQSRRNALNAILGILNSEGKQHLKGLCFKAINEARRYP